MTRILSLLITLPFTLFVILFAVSNTQDTTAYLRLFDATFTLPQYALTLGMTTVGFLAGGLLVWLNLYGYRIKYWQAQRKISRFEDSHEKIKDNHLDNSAKLNEPVDKPGLITAKSSE